MYLNYSLLILTLFKRFSYCFEYLDITNVYVRIIQELEVLNVNCEHTETRWIEQDLDHFDRKETRKWKMRYLERLDYWKSDGPIYLMLGGEGPISKSFASVGIMYELAKETHGAMFISEHRYYGLSKPLNGTDVESLKYLSSRQALADNAYLLKSLKLLSNYKSSKVVVIGGSYAGNLAAWMKLLYPDLVDAAIASSAPVLAKKDFFEYLEKVNDDYKTYGGNDCLERIRNIFNRYDQSFKSWEGLAQLKKEENICAEFDISLSKYKQTFFKEKCTQFSTNCQFGTVASLKNHCKNLTETSVKLFENSMYKCCRYYDFDIMIAQYQENYDFLSWNYQCCTEFGYFQTTSSKLQPFTDNVPLEFYIKKCTNLFGETFNEERVDNGVKAVNEFYGGLKPNVTKVVFTNGDLDPWSTLGILKDLSNETPAIVIPRASHCRDLIPSNDDPEELTQIRENIKAFIKKWIGYSDTVLT